jgi:signal peptidase I
MSTMSLAAEAAPRPRSRILAALLSLLAPGVGHLYVGQRRRALGIVLLNVALFVLFMGVAFLVPPAFLPLVIYGATSIVAALVFYLGSAVDAVRLARRDGVAPRVRWYLLLGAVLAIWAGNLAIESLVPALRPHLPWRTYSVASGSMEPTLVTGEWFIADNRRYAGHPPARGDLVTYRLPSDESTIYIKRIIGLAGDRVAFRDNRAVVNGTVQSEPFADLKDPAAYYATTPEVTVPADHVFVAGDNRANSSDSRVQQHGFVPIRNLTGRATEILLTDDDDRMGLWVGTPAQ